VSAHQGRADWHLDDVAGVIAEIFVALTGIHLCFFWHLVRIFHVDDIRDLSHFSLRAAFSGKCAAI
jgi:predicted membrane-bound dolichyl-phosphate-mannose-protein mannosyltransferase